MSEKDSRPQDFEPISDLKEITRYIQDGVSTGASTIVWTRNHAHLFQTQLMRFQSEDETILVQVPKNFSLEKWLKNLTQEKTTDCLFNLTLTRATIFFKSNYLNLVGGLLRFKLPTKVFKVQRRKNARFKIPEGYLIWVEFKDPLFPDQKLKKKLLDISANGLAFLTGPEDAPMYTEGLVLKDLEFTIRARTFNCESEVRHTQLIELSSRKPMAQVGVLLKNLSPTDGDFLRAYVFDENRKYYSRFL